MADRRQIFISYSHEDEDWCKALARHFSVLRDRVDVWIDTAGIRAGAAWRPEIEQALARAELAILLVSAAFFASDFIHRTELPKLLARRDRGLRVIAVRIKSCGAKGVDWLQSHDYRPRGKHTLSDLGPLDSPVVDREFGKLVDEIADILDELDRPPPPARAAGHDDGAGAQDQAAAARALLVDTLLQEMDAAERAPLAEHVVATLARFGDCTGPALFKATRLLIEHCLLRREMPASPAALRATVEHLGDSETARRLAAGLRQGARSGHFDEAVVDGTSRFFLLARYFSSCHLPALVDDYFAYISQVEHEKARRQPLRHG